MADSRFHKNHGPFDLGAIADRIGCEIAESFKNIEISDVASIDGASQSSVTFLDNVKYKHKLGQTKARACIIAPHMMEEIPDSCIALVVDKPYMAYARVAQMFYPLRAESKENLVHPTVVIGDNVEVGQGTMIDAHTVISDGVVIGENCQIGSNVSISHAMIGNSVRIHNGAKIGQDGFGFALDPTGYVAVPQLGRVVIEDHVNIGANTCIDRGSGPDTVIGAGTIIDNLVQIAHNVKIGKGCVIVAQVGISGSTQIEDYCVFGGQSGVAGHLKIGTGVQVGAQSGVTKDIEAGQKVMGFPARPIREFWREMAQIKKLLSKT